MFMKINKTFAKLALLAGLLTGVPAHAFGTKDGGGGNLLPDRSATIDEVQKSTQLVSDKLLAAALIAMEARENYPALLKYDAALLAQIDGIQDPLSDSNIGELIKREDLLRRVYQKLFHQPDGGTVFDYIPPRDLRSGRLGSEVPIKILPDQPCLDQDGILKDAAAFNSDSKEICFSAPRLAARLKYLRLSAELTALAAHEISHWMGTDPEEAQALQRIILHYFPDDGNLETIIYATQNSESLLSSLQMTQGVLKSIQAGESVAKVCSILGRLAADGERLRSLLFSKGVTFVGVMPPSTLAFRRAQSLNWIYAFLQKQIRIDQVCLPDDDDVKKLDWRDRTTLTIADVIKEAANHPLFSGYVPADPSGDIEKVVIRKLESGDLKTLQLELQELIDMYETAEKAAGPFG